MQKLLFLDMLNASSILISVSIVMRTKIFAGARHALLLVILTCQSLMTWADVLIEANGDISEVSDICFNFQAPNGSGDLTRWTRFHVGELDIGWGTNDDGICRGGSPAFPGNHTGGMDGAACIESELVGPGRIDAYLCSPHIDFSAASNPVVEFLYNFQVLSGPAEGLFELLIGATVPSSETIGTYESIFVQTQDAGTGGGLGSEEYVALDGSVAVGYLCFHYVANNDEYAMLDNVSIGPQACGPSDIDSDQDGVALDIDNCVMVANGDQRDTNGDGFGNRCDPDLDNNCITNFGDLAALKSAFNPAYDPDADLNGDGFVAFGDLAGLKSFFLKAPGPSALANCLAP